MDIRPKVEVVENFLEDLHLIHLVYLDHLIPLVYLVHLVHLNRLVHLVDLGPLVGPHVCRYRSLVDLPKGLDCWVNFGLDFPPPI